MRKNTIIMLLLFIMILQGCSTGKNKDITPTTAVPTETSQVTEAAQVTQAASETGSDDITQAPAATATIAPKTDLVLPVTENESGKVLIQTVSRSITYPYNSYVISSVNRENAVVDPTEMPAADIVDLSPAAILVTHSHPDHIDTAFMVNYDVPKLMCKREDIRTTDFHIYSIPSSHNGDTISEDGQNVIVVFEVDGLRIAHMGDIGQTTLTDEQLQELGEIDIAFMQFENSYSDMTLDNEKGFSIIEQLNPRIIIPTHYSDAALTALEEKYGTITEFDNILEISKEDLPKTNLNVYRIMNNHKYK